MRLNPTQSEIFGFLFEQEDYRANLTEIMRGLSLQPETARKACRELVGLGLVEVRSPRVGEPLAARYYTLTVDGLVALTGSARKGLSALRREGPSPLRRGFWVRVTVDHCDPDASRVQAVDFAAAVEAVLRERFPDVRVVSHVEEADSEGP